MGNGFGQVRHPACASLQYFVAEPDLDCAFQDKYDFIFVAMHVKPVSALGIEAELEKIIGTAGLLRRKLVGA